MSENTKDKKRVLIVDDEPRILRVIEIKLRKSGYEVIAASTGREALHLVEVGNPDIILLDLLLPVMNGFQVLEKLRTFSNLPVLVFSAKSGSSHAAMKLGANDYMNKPFNPDELVRRIESLLRPGG